MVGPPGPLPSPPKGILAVEPIAWPSFQGVIQIHDDDLEATGEIDEGYITATKTRKNMT